MEQRAQVAALDGGRFKVRPQLRRSIANVLLPPYHSNLTKRLIETPKLYMIDTGGIFGLKVSAAETGRPVGVRSTKC